MPTKRPQAFPAINEKPPVSWITPRMIRTQPIVWRFVRTYLVSFT